MVRSGVPVHTFATSAASPVSEASAQLACGHLGRTMACQSTLSRVMWTLKSMEGARFEASCRACVRACVCACMHACVRACVRACVVRCRCLPVYSLASDPAGSEVRDAQHVWAGSVVRC
eukprot:354715-Chlamydomonas_euryale.AAC.5